MAALDSEVHEKVSRGDPIESLFQPDTIAPAEYFDGRRKTAADPEKELVLALIEDAVFCFKKYWGSTREKEQRLCADAEAWFFDDEREWPLSFLNVCDLLELDPAYLRGGLRRWKEEKVRGVSPARTTPGGKKAGSRKRGAFDGRKEASNSSRRRRAKSPAPRVAA